MKFWRSMPLWKKLLYKNIALYFGIIAVAIAFFFGVKYAVNYYAPHIPVYQTNAPNESVTVNQPFQSQIFFNNNLGETIALDKVTALIDQSKKTLEIAIFSMDSDKIAAALLRAQERGVQITLVMDASRAEKHTRVLEGIPGIKRIDVGTYSKDDSENSIYMHHKFILADRGLPTEQMLTGSMDFTAKAEQYEQSFYLITRDHTLIHYYGGMFDLLKKGTFGAAKLNDDTFNPWTAHIEYSDSYINLWFAPGFKQQSVKYQMIKLIREAKKDVKVMMWQFNDKEIAKALVQKAKTGVTVTVIADDLVALEPDSALPILREADDTTKNLILILDTKSKYTIDLSQLTPGFNPFIHHHAMIVDGQTVVLGTNNWTERGFYQNDEDTIITNNEYLVKQFSEVFDYFNKALR